MKALLLIISFFLCIAVFALRPEKTYIETPGNLGLSVIQKNIYTSDGYKINTWFFKTKKTPQKVIVFCNGDAGNKSYLLDYVKPLLEKNIAVVLFDYRGFGGSSDFKIKADFLYYNEFLLDYEAVLKETKKMFPRLRIGVLSFSMGGYFPLISKSKIDFYVADSPLLSPSNTLERLIATKKKIYLPGKLYSLRISQISSLIIYLADNDKNIKEIDASAILKQKTAKQFVKIVNYNGDHCSYFSTAPQQILNDLINI